MKRRIRRLLGRLSRGRIGTTSDPPSGEGGFRGTRPQDAPLREAREVHRTMLTPSYLEERPTSVAVETEVLRGLWVAEFPDEPLDGLFESLYAAGETQSTTISLHLSPRDTQQTLTALENKLEDLEADVLYLAKRHRAGARGIQRDLEDHRALYDVLRNSPMRAFDVSMYLAVRRDSREDLERTSDRVTTVARRAPANLTPVTPRWHQRDALVAASPVALDPLDHTLGTRTPMLGGAVGAMYPFVAGVVAEHGIEYGTYALNESPVVIDRFNRETGYCTMVIGSLGAGKSFSTKLQLLRRAMFDRETLIIMLDPLHGFAGVNEALGGERVTVGGRRGFNPLELKPTPIEVLQAVPDLDPWAEQVDWVMGFFERFFEDVAGNPLGSRTQTLRRAVQDVYEQAGITRDPATHGRDSPTIRDLLAVLEDLRERPDAFGYVTSGELEGVQVDAQSLLKDLRPSFRVGGDLENLARPTEFDLDSKVIYLDLHQEEGARGRTQTSLMMQVLFNAVYERAKATDKRVVFAIDEAHYLWQTESSLEFLETAVRHSRHYDLSIQFVTQTGGEFALSPGTRTIATLCSMTLIHRVREEAEKLATWFGLSDREVDWVRTAKAGNDEDGYAEALLGIDEEGWFPLRVRASEFETRAITTGISEEADRASPEVERESVREGSVDTEAASTVRGRGRGGTGLGEE